MSSRIPKKFRAIINAAKSAVEEELSAEFNVRNVEHVRRYISRCFSLIHRPHLERELEYDSFWICLRCKMEEDAFRPEDSLYGEIHWFIVRAKITFQWDIPFVVGAPGPCPEVCPSCESADALREIPITSPKDFQRQATQRRCNL